MIKTLREEAHAEAVVNAALRRFGGAEYAFTRILSYGILIYYFICQLIIKNKKKVAIIKKLVHNKNSNNSYF